MPENLLHPLWILLLIVDNKINTNCDSDVCFVLGFI
jgi:hypothetical protein